MRTPKLLLSLTSLCLVTSTVAAGAATAQSVSAPRPVVLFASPDGSGTACDIRSPCSLTGAKARVEQLNQDMTSDIDVDLSGGTYRLSAGLQSARRTPAATAIAWSGRRRPASPR